MAPTDPPKPKLARDATPAERQAAQLSKLLANPDKDVYIPQRPKEGASKTLRPPREMMKNVQGSSAGAGSGEFHVYKQSRRREYERLKIMDEEEEFARQKAEALARQAANEAAAEEKTAKNRLKRQRKKEAQRGAKGKAGPAALSATSAGAGGAAGEDGGEKKRKLAGGASFKFKTAEERDEEGDEQEDEEEAAPARKALSLSAPMPARAGEEEIEQAAPAKEAGITIQDDD
ncbi:hypothetical protein JCM10213_004830 [Rhodosporidiobolus nylandii]